jgi:hypothetical protein
MIACNNSVSVKSDSGKSDTTPKYKTEPIKCYPDKLYGDWIYLASYKCRLTQIDTLKKESFKSNYGTPSMTYNKTGVYINNQGDYKTSGKFLIDTKSCLLKEFDDNGAKGDTSYFEITYLDNKYLLVVRTQDNYSASYFYKRK